VPPRATQAASIEQNVKRADKPQIRYARVPGEGSQIDEHQRPRMSLPLLLALMAAAGAAPTAPVTVIGQCPSAQALTAALGAALGGEAKIAVAEIPRVSDEGDRFSVVALGQSRQFADPTRDCDERARAAAVFIALVLNPPIVPRAPEPAAPQVAATAPPPPAPAAPGWFDVGAAARVDGGPASETSTALGFEVRASAGRRWLGVAATAAILAPTETMLSSVRIRQQRFPLGVALTARHALSPRFLLAGAAGAALVPLTLRGDTLTGGSTETRLDAGIRLAAELRIRATPRLTPFLDLHAEIFPRAYQLDVDPLGTIGSTGRFWAGASVGLSFEAGAPP
jgi:hypothetical protein